MQMKIIYEVKNQSNNNNSYINHHRFYILYYWDLRVYDTFQSNRLLRRGGKATMKDIYFKNICRTGPFQIHVGPTTIPLMKIKIDTKLERVV